MKLYVKRPERDEALPSLLSSVFTEQNIFSNLLIVQKNLKGGNHQIA